MPAPRSLNLCCKFVLSRKFRIVLVLFLLFTNSTLTAQNLRIEKIHCSLSKANLASIQKIARYEATFYNAVFDTEKNDSLAIRVRIFGRQEDFKQTPDGENVLHLSSDGYLLANTNQIFVLKSEHVNSVLLHEISHAFLHNNMRNPPQWFDEGLATYFGSLTVEKDKLFYTPITGRIQRIREMNQNGTLKLADFLNKNERRWTGTDSQISDQYTIAYSLIYFLIKTNLNLVKHLADELNNGQSAFTILSQDFGGFEFFQSKYIKFYQQQS
ncbi:MAG: DUF1570 domain-containing protein [Sphingobacteriaceae bacterium]|nr:MAG: DUF1570 domain-containing protein [Sphingobacteriaceae bacterium]